MNVKPCKTASARRLRALLLGVIAWVSLVSGAPSAFALSLYQVDWFNGTTGATPIQNTTWGHAAIDLTPGPGVQYVNIVAPDPGGTYQWLAQNVPLFAGSYGATTDPTCVNVDLSKIGITRGTSAAGSQFGYIVGGFVESIAGLTAGDLTGTGTIAAQPIVYDYGFDFHDLGDDPSTPGTPTGYTTLSDPVLIDPGAAPGPTLPQTAPGPTPPVLVNRTNMKAAEQGVNECAPGSAANSIYWLHDQYGLDIGGLSIDALHAQLVGLMKTDPKKGTTIANFIAGKETFLKDKDVIQKGALGSNVTWEWIEKEIDEGEDVELWYAWWGKVKYKDASGVEQEKWAWVGHAVTIQGKYDDGTDRWLLLRDDMNQGVAGGTAAARWTRVGSQFPGYLSLLDESKYTYAYFAYSESVPEPATASLLASGFLGVVFCRRRRTRPTA